MTFRIHIKDWKKYPDAVYAGRPGKGQEGYFGSPIVIGTKCSVCLEIHLNAGSTIPCFTAYFLKKLGNDLIFRKRVLELKDLVLVCFCGPDSPCHTQVIIDWLDGDRKVSLETAASDPARGSDADSGDDDSI